MTAPAPRSTARLRKLPTRYTPVVFSFYMAAIMALVMCFVLVGVGSGLGPGYLSRVLHAYALAMPIAFAAVMTVRPLVMKLVALTVQAPSSTQAPQSSKTS
jgi:hypothetical protein